jgi:hypothetical protein
MAFISLSDAMAPLYASIKSFKLFEVVLNVAFSAFKSMSMGSQTDMPLFTNT